MARIEAPDTQKNDRNKLQEKSKKLRVNGLGVVEFNERHVLSDCKIVPVFVTIDRGGGAINIGILSEDDYAGDAFVYHDECLGHRVISADYKLLSPIGTG